MTHSNRQVQLPALIHGLRRYWVIIAALLIFGSVLIAGSPAWAATVGNAPNQTVPVKSHLYLPWILHNGN